MQVGRAYQMKTRERREREQVNGNVAGTGSGSNLAHRVVVRLVLVELLLNQMRELAVPLVSTAHTCGITTLVTLCMNSSWQSARELCFE